MVTLHFEEETSLDANGGGQDGQIILSANRIINAKFHSDIRLHVKKY